MLHKHPIILVHSNLMREGAIELEGDHKKKSLFPSGDLTTSRKGSHSKNNVTRAIEKRLMKKLLAEKEDETDFFFFFFRSISEIVNKFSPIFRNKAENVS
ncbi:hypothetical protein PR048_018554 [Dryococelus australis]|uniref:Uncharacterized protein n=1 Tax=Dryococelus australis TaxID=614101 RepID=A0ABQ9HD04_9NEOP|nr:hypothetical protein PR048_018554 [Dryococelus australis]